MADGTRGNFDFSGWTKGLENLVGPVRVSLARSMAVAGGEVLRDEAKARAPVGTEQGGSIYPGALQKAIYLAYKPERSLDGQVVYSVSWNSKKAPHGHLLEFGHWQTRKVAKIPGGYGGGFYSTSTELDKPKWVAAHPFLRPTFDAAIGRAKVAMIQRGRERLPELLAGVKAETTE